MIAFLFKKATPPPITNLCVNKIRNYSNKNKPVNSNAGNLSYSLYLWPYSEVLIKKNPNPLALSLSKWASGKVIYYLLRFGYTRVLVILELLFGNIYEESQKILFIHSFSYRS